MGVVRDLLQNVPLPNFYRVTNHMDDTHIQDPAQAVRDALKREGTLERIRPGSTVCLTAASREIDNIVLILRTLVEELKKIENEYCNLLKNGENHIPYDYYRTVFESNQSYKKTNIYSGKLT